MLTKRKNAQHNLYLINCDNRDSQRMMKSHTERHIKIQFQIMKTILFLSSFNRLNALGLIRSSIELYHKFQFIKYRKLVQMV